MQRTLGILGVVIAAATLVWAVFTYVQPPAPGGAASGNTVTTGNNSPVVIGSGNTQTND